MGVLLHPYLIRHWFTPHYSLFPLVIPTGMSEANETERISTKNITKIRSTALGMTNRKPNGVKKRQVLHLPFFH